MRVSRLQSPLPHGGKGGAGTSAALPATTTSRNNKTKKDGVGESQSIYEMLVDVQEVREAAQEKRKEKGIGIGTE